MKKKEEDKKSIIYLHWISLRLIQSSSRDVCVCFHVHVPKKPKVYKKIYFWYFKVQVKKLTQIENFQILGIFETNRSVGAKPLTRCANIIADSDTFKR